MEKVGGVADDGDDLVGPPGFEEEALGDAVVDRLDGLVEAVEAGHENPHDPGIVFLDPFEEGYALHSRQLLIAQDDFDGVQKANFARLLGRLGGVEDEIGS